MPKTTIPFSAFVEAAGPEHADFIHALHDYMTEQDCKMELKEAANGYVVSYVHKPSNRTAANYVFRKKGPMMRIYADNVPSYIEILADWPASMKDAVKKAGPCKRLLNPEDCNSRCPMGYDFVLDGQQQQKCRYGGFMFFLDDETKPHLRNMMEREMQERQ
jgi:hypothetical protein